MQSVQIAIVNAGSGAWSKVSTSITFGKMGVSYPPSADLFRAEEAPVIDLIICLLLDNQAPLLVNIHPYFAYRDNRGSMSLDYSLFMANCVVVRDGPFRYRNPFDVMLDLVYSVLKKKNTGSLWVVASKTRWPTSGDFEASVDNARISKSNLVQHVKGGTLKRARPIENFVFEMFNKNQKNPQLDSYWGLKPQYDINLN